MFLLSQCMLCGASRPYPQAICPGCRADLPWIESGCPGCGLPLPTATEQFHCGECLTGDSPFTSVVTPLLYQQPVKQLITAFKHRRGLAQGQLLAQLLGDEIHDFYLGADIPEVIIPVPLHWQRWLWRGYNQSAELGKQLSRQLGIPCDRKLLQRVRRTPSQQGLSRQQRLLNLQGAFRVKNKIPFQRIALLDDVVTTGSTATEIARYLRAQGVSEVHLWAVARTPLSPGLISAVEMSRH